MSRLLTALTCTLLLTLGCGDPNKPPSSDCQQPEGLPQLGAPVVLSSALPRVMGSHLTARDCAASRQGLVSASRAGSSINGEALRGRIEDLYIPVAPVLTPQETLERPGRILRVDAEGRMTDFHVFSDEPSNYSTGFFSSTKLEGREVLMPRGLVHAPPSGSGGGERGAPGSGQQGADEGEDTASRLSPSCSGGRSTSTCSPA
ncbi:hypothetical protein JQX13_17970 [Archangium violaceum]|uniref:hypothetical protein n=1 Tax=Archangium violaceum TaxID=83451 RepID=UPI00193B30C8|nr:hypothetical protein [Archangium violaceum]QRK11778.1 hypothetical protein JQX13_17970 [Archangium violaceum]